MLSTSRARLFALVRDFAVTTPEWAQAIRYETKPEEVHDLTLVAVRVYGRRTEALVIQAAAGLDSPEQPLPEQRLVLPTAARLRELKRLAGYSDGDIL